MEIPKCKRCKEDIIHNDLHPLDGNGPIHTIGSDTYCHECYLELRHKYQDNEYEYEYFDEDYLDKEHDD